jgi:predicted AAA+ superfamily ATPase
MQIVNIIYNLHGGTMYLNRYTEDKIKKIVKYFPVTAIVGPRQCGKSTLAKHIMNEFHEFDYLDLENPTDMAKMANPQLYLSIQKDKLICIDEIQRIPELFPLLRSLVDQWDRKSAFLILGSASRDLLRQSSETLAGRIAYVNLTPFLISEINSTKGYSLEKYFVRGGFPGSYLAENDEVAETWLSNFITTFLERDMLFWENFTPATMRRLWQMLAHLNGQTVNYSAIGSSLDISHNTVKAYIDLLASTFMIEVIPPWFSNMGKRIVKAPKVYIADSGVLCNLIGIKSFNSLMGHPAFGSVWEQIVLTNIRGIFSNAEIYHYRTSNGAEMDFVLKFGEKIIAIECKTSLSPTLSKGSYNSIEDIMPIKTFVVIPGESGWPMSDEIDVVVLDELLDKIEELIK